MDEKIKAPSLGVQKTMRHLENMRAAGTPEPQVVAFAAMMPGFYDSFTAFGDKRLPLDDFLDTLGWVVGCMISEAIIYSVARENPALMFQHGQRVVTTISTQATNMLNLNVLNPPQPEAPLDEDAETKGSA